MANILNAKSEHIDIFPISIDRIGNTQIATKYTRKVDYTSIDNFESASDDIRSFVQQTVVFYTIPATESHYTKYLKYYNDDPDISVSISNVANGRSLTEQNLTSIIRKLTDRANFVIDASIADAVNNKKEGYIEFMFNGHYFKVTDPDILSNSDLWVTVEYTNIGTDFGMLNGWDKSYTEGNDTYFEFTGVNFYDTAPGDIDKLQLLADGKVPTDSYVKFDTYSIKNINGGTV